MTGLPGSSPRLVASPSPLDIDMGERATTAIAFHALRGFRFQGKTPRQKRSVYAIVSGMPAR